MYDVRCGLIWLQRVRKVEQMWSKLMCFGMHMNQSEDRCINFSIHLIGGSSFRGLYISFCELLIFIWLLVQYNFKGKNDIVKFVKLVGSSGLYLHLRIGPYVCAEWNFGSHLFSLLHHTSSYVWLHFHLWKIFQVQCIIMLLYREKSSMCWLFS